MEEDKNQIRSLSKNKIENYQCNFCDKTFDSKYAKSNLYHHVKTSHSGKDFGKCKLCGNIFGSTRQLTKHTEEVHNNKKILMWNM